MTSPASFWVRMCSVCGKRVNVETPKTDGDGLAFHEECYLSRGHSKKSEDQTRPTGNDVDEYES
jgi:hypothetical protein